MAYDYHVFLPNQEYLGPYSGPLPLTRGASLYIGGRFHLVEDVIHSQSFSHPLAIAQRTTPPPYYHKIVTAAFEREL
jgi:hypothetical protein